MNKKKDIYSVSTTKAFVGDRVALHVIRYFYVYHYAGLTFLWHFNI